MEMELEVSESKTQLPDSDISIEKSMLFSNFDFPSCRIQYFNEKEDLVAIFQDEARRLLIEIEATMKEIDTSKFYKKMWKQLQREKIQINIKRVLGSQTNLTMVIYALGSMEYSYDSQFQLAIALLLKRDFDWIGEIEVFDPMFSPSDSLVLKKLGCNVLLVNEECRRKVEKPTLFFMPNHDPMHMGNLLEANWWPSRINNMILLSNFFINHGYTKRWEYEGKVYYNAHYIYTEAIQKFVVEFKIRSPIKLLGGFSKFSWKFFKVDHDLDMETLLLDGFTKEERLKEARRNDRHSKNRGDYIHLRNCSENFHLRTFKENIEGDGDDDRKKPGYWVEQYSTYRIPRRHRCLWRPPFTGWTKLNYSGKGYDGNKNAGFGGVFCNEFKQQLLVYSGSLGGVDSKIANAEALIQGLKCLPYITAPIKRLVIEGNDFRLSQWINHALEPPKQMRELVRQIWDLLRKVEWVVYHVYDEANSLAIELAHKSASLYNLRIWVG
ncbi:Protein SENSITIVITY TO RED LIGHT REDUCED like [Quillaja saponaria]|uniref:Protein SENSITIVITY TO RED LIGHT REDUCED like n=1 Tax=Quillaja saponaria TaxID=32244 RepID=A0AAD7QFB5_QUISA|nr:Protein SENSITIVITY TO RED LIGHT REDUCED like [Quillaja saponaria]